MRDPARCYGLTSLCVLLTMLRFGGLSCARETAEPEKPGQAKPNFVVVLADDLGWGDLACYGHEEIKTPNLDRMAKEGVLFTQFYANSGVCSPSRAAFLTGQFPARNRLHAQLLRVKEKNEVRGIPDFLDPGAPTVARLLRDGGYRTAHFGKWHLGNTSDAPPPNAYGFDEHYSIAANGPGWDRQGESIRPRSTELIIDKTIHFIQQNRDKPFYVQACLWDPHRWLEPTEEQMKPYDELRGAIRGYYATVTNIDHHVGRLLGRIAELGLDKNTVVIFTSDNGPEDIVIDPEYGVGSAGPFRGRKRSLYEGGIRMPLIVRWPGTVPPGKVNDSIVTAVDFLPTFCSLAGINAHEKLALDGLDVTEAFRGQVITRSKPLMWEWRYMIYGHVIHRSPALAIRDGKWKLLMNPVRDRVELYDIAADPTELNNLADRQPQEVKQLSEKLMQWHTALPKGKWEVGMGSNQYPWPR